MNLEQYQAQAEEVVKDLKAFYVFLERTDFLEELMDLQRNSLLKQEKLKAESMEDDEAMQHMKSALISVVEMSEEEVMERLMKNFKNLCIKSEGKVLDALFN